MSTAHTLSTRSGKREAEQARPGANVDHDIVCRRLGQFHDPRAQVAKTVAPGDFLSVHHVVVPVFRQCGDPQLLDLSYAM